MVQRRNNDGEIHSVTGLVGPQVEEATDIPSFPTDALIPSEKNKI